MIALIARRSGDRYERYGSSKGQWPNAHHDRGPRSGSGRPRIEMRPASMTVTTRLTRNRAISGCLRDLDENGQPNECVEKLRALDCRNVASDLPLPVSQAEVGAAEAHPRIARRARRDVGLHEDPAVLEKASSCGVALFSNRDRGRPPSRRSASDGDFALSAAAKTAGTTDAVAIESRPARAGPFRKRRIPERYLDLPSGHPGPSRGELGQDRVRPVRNVLRATRDPRGAVVLRKLGRLAPPGKSRRRSTCTRHAPAERQARRASSSRPRGVRLATRTSPRRSAKHSKQVTR